MNILSKFKQEHGYTLLETVVALALFVSVLIPIGVTIGNFLIDGTTDRLHQALQCAQTQMDYVFNTQNFNSMRTKTDQNLILQRNVQRIGNRVDVEIIITSSKRPDRTIIVMHKSLLVSQ